MGPGGGEFESVVSAANPNRRANAYDSGDRMLTMARDGRRDPVERASTEGVDLYDIASWESRTWVDRFSVGVYRWGVRFARWLVILLALAILLVQFAFAGLAAITNPYIGAFILLSVVPALLLAGYVWRTDVTIHEPLGLLVGTFLLGVLFASFAAVVNSFGQALIGGLPIVGMTLFFFLVVGPVEETVKWLAVRLYAYRDARFHAVIDGAVYGAMAGLGFATIENTLYIGQQYVSALETGGAGSPIFGAALPTAFVRSFAGPGHVIYSAFAGYYLGLAKFNPENAGPIAVKGILIAAFIHGLYNTTVTYLGSFANVLGIAVPGVVLFLGFVVVYDGALLFFLLRKLSRYRHAFREAAAGEAADEPVGNLDELAVDDIDTAESISQSDGHEEP